MGVEVVTDMARGGVTIGQAARAAGVTRKAVRLYEAKGLLPKTDRSTSGYRLHSPSDVELLVFIRRARALGLHLDDIRDILDVKMRGTAPCGTVRDLLDARIAEIDAAVSELLALRRTLTATSSAAADCTDAFATVCSIIETGPAAG
jgi:MerR family copper efflux transcriptional regulator